MDGRKLGGGKIWNLKVNSGSLEMQGVVKAELLGSEGTSQPPWNSVKGCSVKDHRKKVLRESSL